MRPKQVVDCPTCRARNVDVVWVGATARYGDHDVPGTQTQCETFGAGIGNHNLAAARDVTPR